MRSSYRVVIAIMLGVVLVAAACGNDDDSSGRAGDGVVGEETSEETSEPAPEPDDDSEETSEPAPEPDDSDVFIPIEGVPGVSDEEIGVAVIATKANNPLGTCILDCYKTGIQAYFDMVNSEGGLYGRQLVIHETLDDELFNNQAASLEVIAEEDSLAVFTATLFASGWADLDEAGVPSYHWGLHPSTANGLQSNFSIQAPSCANCTNRFMPFLVQQAGATRVASLGYGISENSKVCASTYADSIEAYFDEVGAEVVYLNDEMAFGLPNGVGPEVTAMVEAGVDFIASCLDLNAMKTIAQELERQGVRDQITMHHPNSYDHDFVAEAGSLFDGDFVVVGFAPFESRGVPAVAEFLEWVDAQGGQVAEQTMFGWINADLFVQGLKAAGPEFNRESLIEATNTMLTDYSADGLVNPIDWSRQHDSPTPEDRISNGHRHECSGIVRMQGGAFELVGGSNSPFLCWDNSTTDWADPEPTNFS